MKTLIEIKKEVIPAEAIELIEKLRAEYGDSVVLHIVVKIKR